MCGKRVENPSESSRMISEFQGYPDLLRYTSGGDHGGGGVGGGGGYGGLGIPEPSIQPWSTIPDVPSFGSNPVHFTTATRALDQDHFLSCMASSSSSSSSYHGFHRAALQFGYDNGTNQNHQISGAGMFVSDPLVPSLPGSSSLGLQDFGKMSQQEIMDAKALAASKSHSEAERRRRERINKHLATLRNLLPNTTKTDKASLLAEVIQHVKELKRQTLEIAEGSQVPTEIDELSVHSDDSCGDGKLVIRASLCCEDRSDLLPDLIKTLKALRLRTLKAEIATLGGRVKNVLLVTGEDDDSNNENQTGTFNNNNNPSIGSIQDALKAVMERAVSDDSSAGNIKRQRTNISILDHRSI